MDNLTHSLVGAALSKAGAERTTPLATATLVLAANAPDVDMLAYVHGEYFALSFRRGITHGIPAMIVWPFVLVGLALAWDRWVRRRRDPDAPPVRAGPLLAWSAVAVLTHPVLDWMNTYGMRLWLPLDGSWSYGDALFIIDPWIWLVLGGTVFLSAEPGRRGRGGWGGLGALCTALVLVAPIPMLAKALWLLGIAAIVGTRLAGRPRSEQGRTRVVRWGSAVTAAYVLAMAAADVPASAQVERAAREAGIEVVDVMVSPEPATPLAASVEVLTPEAIVPGSHRWLAAERARVSPSQAVPLLSGPAGVSEERLVEVVDAARGDVEAARWLVWSRYPYARVEPDGQGWMVRFGDARYDDRPESGGLGGLVVRLDADLTVLPRRGESSARVAPAPPRGAHAGPTLAFMPNAPCA